MRELVGGTLEENVAAEVRSHLQICAPCRGLYEGLYSNVEVELGGSRYRSTSQFRSQIAKDQRSSTEPESSFPQYSAGWPGSITFVGRLAMGRQVAAAAVMLVVVAVGLWYVPRLSQHPEAIGSTITHPEFSDASRALDRLKPAEPLDLAIDKRSGRIHPKGTIPPSMASYRRAVAPNTDTRLDPPGSIKTEPVLGDPSNAINANAEPNRDTKSTTAGQSAQTDKSTPATVVEAISDVHNPPNAPSESPVLEAADEIYKRAIIFYRSGNFESAIEDLNQIVDRKAAYTLHPKALLYLARCYAESGRCVLALPQYRKLIARFPVKPEGGDAMVEAAACYRKIGENARSAELVERASQQRWLTPRARRELKRLGY
jgi:tetratricopeptide (TPR) repeat protein